MKAKVIIILAKAHLYIFFTPRCYHISLKRVFLNIKVLKVEAFSILHIDILHIGAIPTWRDYQLSDIYMHLQNLFYSFVSKAPTHVASSCIVDCGENVLIFVTGVELVF